MKCETLRKAVKFTVFSENHMNEILDLTTEPVLQTRAKVVSGDSEMMMKSKASKKLVKFLEGIGCQVDYITVTKRRGKKFMADLPVDVKPRKGNNYKSGVVVSCLAEAMTERDLDKKMWEIEDSLLNLFTKKGVPVDRICKEAVVGCEYKFY